MVAHRTRADDASTFMLMLATRCSFDARAGCREWSLLVPAYGMVLVLLTYFTYFALALAGTPSFADMRTITGECVSPQPSPPSPGSRLVARGSGTGTGTGHSV